MVHRITGALLYFEYLEIPANSPHWDQLETHLLLSLEESAREAVSQHVTSIEEVHRCGLML